MFTGVAQHISIISDRLGTVLDTIKLGTQTGLDVDCVILDLEKTTQNTHPQHMQVNCCFVTSQNNCYC